MPIAPPKPCSHPLCPGFAEVKGRCRQHARENDLRRGNFRQRGYTSAWDRLSKAFRRAHPLCKACEDRGLIVSSTCVDHIIAKALGGTDDESNLKALCWPCHSRKTVSEDGGFGRKIKGGNGG